MTTDIYARVCPHLFSLSLLAFSAAQLMREKPRETNGFFNEYLSVRVN